MILSLLLSSFISSAVFAADSDKEINEAAQKVCNAAYVQFAKEHPASKKLSATDKKALLGSCIVNNQRAAGVCAKAFIGKIAVLNRNKAKQNEIKDKVKKELQPELQACLTKVNTKSIDDLNQSGKIRIK